MTSSSEERTAAVLLESIPAELPIPRADPVVVVHLAVVQLAQQSAVNDRLGRLKLAAVTALETDAGLHAGLLHGGDHRVHVPL